MLGTGATMGAVAAVAPSQVWPFKKIFLPTMRFFGWDWGYQDSIAQIVYAKHNGRIDMLDVSIWRRAPYPGPLSQPATIERLTEAELVYFAKGLPDLVSRDQTLYKYFKESRSIEMVCPPQQADAWKNLARRPAFRVPMRMENERWINNADHSAGYVVEDNLSQKPSQVLRAAGRKLRDSLGLDNSSLDPENVLGQVSELLEG